MSIVGPRPCIPYEYERYSAWQRDRLKSVPGLTGLWQVSGKNRTTFEQMVRLDIAYADRISLREDLRIMLKTLPALWPQLSDTRTARRQVTETGLTPEAASLPDSATFVARSQNVIAGTHVEDNRDVATRQSQQSCVSYRTSSEAGALKPDANDRSTRV
jgi:hypothetical protein